MALRIDVATNYGEPLSETAYLTLSLKANASAGFSTVVEITALANSSSVSVPYVVPEKAGDYQLSIFDKRTGLSIKASPFTLVVGGTCPWRSAMTVPAPARRDAVPVAATELFSGRTLFERSFAVGLSCKAGEHIETTAQGDLYCVSCQPGYFSKGGFGEPCSACAPGMCSVQCRSPLICDRACARCHRREALCQS